MGEVRDIGAGGLAAARPKVMLAAGGLAAVVLVGVGVWLVFGGGDDAGSDAAATATTVTTPSGLPEPSAEDAAATRAWLEGEGAALFTMHDAATAMTEPGVAAESCAANSDRLDTDAPAELMFHLATGVADSPLRNMLLEERILLGEAYTACVNGTAPQLDELADVVELIDVRFDELRVQR